jgi:hypothetical protein
MTRTYPYGRERLDSACFPFRSESLARASAAILERMTGDMCIAQQRGPNWFIIERYTPEGKVVRG